MQGLRVNIGKLLGVIVWCALILAGLRSGSNDWYKSIYTLTFLTLVYAAIVARYGRPFWHGFALAGWAYFLIGYGAWIGGSSEGHGKVNRSLVSSVVLEMVTGQLTSRERLPVVGGKPTYTLEFDTHWDNRDGIGHCALTTLFAAIGGLVATSAARRGVNSAADLAPARENDR
jgi:hypothetical protein